MGEGWISGGVREWGGGRRRLDRSYKPLSYRRIVTIMMGLV